MSFSKNLIKLQEENHETNYRLAKEIGMHQTTVQNWRDGQKPILEHLAKVAAHYGCTVDDLLRQDNGEKSV